MIRNIVDNLATSVGVLQEWGAEQHLVERLDQQRAAAGEILFADLDYTTRVSDAVRWSS